MHTLASQALETVAERVSSKQMIPAVGERIFPPFFVTKSGAPPTFCHKKVVPLPTFLSQKVALRPPFVTKSQVALRPPFVTKSGAALATRSPKMQANLESARKPSLAARVADESVTERSMHVHGSYATIHGDLVWGDLWEICGRSWEIWGDIYACMDRTLQYTEI